MPKCSTASYFGSTIAQPSVAKGRVERIDIHNVNEIEEEKYVGGLNGRQ